MARVAIRAIRMVKLPTFEDLGQRDPHASIPQLDYGSNPAPRALQGLGGALSDAGDTLAVQARRKQAEGDRQNSFNTQSSYLQHADQWRKYMLDASEHEKPGAAGFATRIGKEIDAANKKWFAGVPKEEQGEYGPRLFSLRSAIVNSADDFERKSRDLHADIQIADGQQSLLNRQRDNPATWEEVQKEGERLISNSPKSEIEKEANLAKWRRDRAEAWGWDNRKSLLKPNRGSSTSGVRPELQSAVERMRANLKAQGIDIDIVQGERTASDQAQLYAQGRTAPGPIVTYAKPGSSRHETGEAVDVVPTSLKGTKNWSPDNPIWDKVGAAARAAGLEWGGDWRHRDRPHVQLAGARRGGAVASNASPNDLYQIVRNIESSNGQDTRISSAGAAGPMQVVPETAREIARKLGDKNFPTNGSDADVQAYMRGRAGDSYGAYYLGEQIKEFGSSDDALVAYNWGPQNAREWIAAGRDMSKLPSETQAYLAKAHAQMGNPSEAPAIDRTFQGVPQLDGLPYADRVKLYERIVADDEAEQKQREMELRSSLEGSVPDILTSYQLSGGYNGQEPTPQDFDMAYGDKAAVKWSEFESSREAAKSVNHYKNMSANEISADLQSVQSQIPLGPGAEHAQKLFEARQSGADGVLKQRAADPAGYILNNFPDVKAAWDKPYDPEHPENFVPAMNMLADREEQLGMDVVPLPKEYASKAVKLFKDESLPIDRRANAIASTILVTPDKKQRAAIFNQLVSVGLPERSMAAVDAYARGDSAGAARLFAAAALDAKDVPNLSDDRMAVLRKSLQDRMLDEGSRGNALYGLKYLNPANIQRATRDMALAETSVKMRIAAGEGDTEAIDGALKDIWGNVERMDINLRLAGQRLVWSRLARIRPSLWTAWKR
jgi:hypothetical protein